MNTPYQLLGGEDGVRRLCDAFYDCMEHLPEAADIRRMHGADLTEIRQKLFEYLSGWLGGPHLYAQKYGSICMTGPHRPYAIGPKERDQWLLCMNRALEQVGASAEVQAMLERPLQALTDMIRNRETSEPA
jgi:hemoglobin